jgi:hypothetical protein
VWPTRPRQESREVERPALTDFVIDYAAPGCVIAHLRNLTFCAWNTPPVAAHVAAFVGVAEQLSQAYPRSSNVTLVMRDAELPGSEARIALEQLTAQYAGIIHSVALVIDGDGFWASMIRSFLTGLHLLRGHGYRCKAFGNAAEVSSWLLPSHSADTGVAISARELDAACEAIYRRMRDEGRPG